MDHGETLEDAARRELREETGVSVADIGPVVFSQSVQLEFEGIRYQQDEHYFRVRVDEIAVDETGWTDTERRVVVEHRWWSVSELDSTDETVYPQNLAALLSGHVPAFRDSSPGPPSQPWHSRPSRLSQGGESEAHGHPLS